VIQGHARFESYSAVRVNDELLSKKQVAEIAPTVVNMNLWTRLKLAPGEILMVE
jgi:hypothetical protein